MTDITTPTNQVESAIWRSQPLAVVKTLFYKKVGSSFAAIEQTSASDSVKTISTPFANAFA